MKQQTRSWSYRHVDVFASGPFGGNSLPVFLDGPDDAELMLKMTQELRHFEAIFLRPGSTDNAFHARVFDLLEELPFAGHPVIGAAAVLHERQGSYDDQIWQITLPDRTVSVTTVREGNIYRGLLNQGDATFFSAKPDQEHFARLFGLSSSELRSEFPLEVGSTGLRYLVIPVTSNGLENARIQADLSPALSAVNAQFAVLLDVANMEIRHWNNDGVLEDTATGSAAGVVAAYLLRHGLVSRRQVTDLAQGRFTGRPSRISVYCDGDPEHPHSVHVGGSVVMMGRGALEIVEC